jgi:hypothetical protein
MKVPWCYSLKWAYFTSSNTGRIMRISRDLKKSCSSDSLFTSSTWHTLKLNSGLCSKKSVPSYLDNGRTSILSSHLLGLPSIYISYDYFISTKTYVCLTVFLWHISYLMFFIPLTCMISLNWQNQMLQHARAHTHTQLWMIHHEG